MDLSNFSLGDIQQYLQGVDFPLDKEDAIKVAENNGAPQQVTEQMRNRLPEGEISGPQDVLNAVQGLI